MNYVSASIPKLLYAEHIGKVNNVFYYITFLHGSSFKWIHFIFQTRYGGEIYILNYDSKNLLIDLAFSS